MAQEKHGGLCTKATPLGQSPLGGRVGRAGRCQTTRQDREGRPRLGTDGCRVVTWAQRRFQGHSGSWEAAVGPMTEAGRTEADSEGWCWVR